MVRFYPFIEGQTYLSKDVPEFFIENGYFIVNKKGTLTLKVCGLANLNDKNYFFLPKGYDANSSHYQKQETAKLVFHSLIKYKNSVTLSEEELDWLGKDSPDSSYIDLVDWLIYDYLSHGFYIETLKKREVNGKGRIDWSRTIKAQLPIVQEHQFYYFDVLTKKNEINLNNLITVIHKKVINECMENFGWLYNVSNQEKNIELSIEKEEQIILLQKKLKETYVGHDIKLITSLIIYLRETRRDNHNFNLVTPYFYTVWEEMVQITFKHDNELKKYIPRPYWMIENKKIYTRQVPDVLVELENGLAVLDAKYYSTSNGEISRYPGWESIVKQLYYNKSLENKYEYIQNIFIMPDTVRMKRGYKKIGYTSVETNEKDFGYVFALGIDIDTVLKSYTRNSYLTEIFKEIISVSNIGNFNDQI